MAVQEVEYTAKEVAAHNTSNDVWMTIHGQGITPLVNVIDVNIANSLLPSV
jgi:hypothetical protein